MSTIKRFEIDMLDVKAADAFLLQMKQVPVPVFLNCSIKQLN